LSEEEFKEAIESFHRFPKDVRRIIREDIETAFINRVKAMKRVLKLD